MIKLKKLLALSMALSVSLSGFTCNVNAANKSETEYLESLKIGTTSYPSNLDPSISVGKQYSRIEQQIFDKLLYRDPSGSGRLQSYICESWEQIDDTIVEFVLKDGITFHDGTPMTSSDVKYSFDRHLLDEEKIYSTNVTNLMTSIESVEIVDELTVRFNLYYDDPVFFDRIGAEMAVYIIPKAYFEEVGKDEFAVKPIGSGPYKVESYTPEELSLGYYEGYYGEKPVAEKVVYKKITEEAAMLAAITSGEIDMAYDISVAAYNAAQTYDNLQVYSEPVGTGYIMFFQTDMTDKYLRQAMSLSINRQLICDAIFEGLAFVPNSYNYKEFGECYLEDYVGNEYDIEKAKELLAQSSYNGEVMKWDIVKGYYANYDQVAEACVDMWKEIGINVEIEYVESISWDNATFHIAAWSNGLRFNDPLGGLWVMWGEGSEIQELFWTDVSARFNELGVQLEKETDVEKRREVYREMVEIYDEEVPGMILYAANENWIVRDGLEWIHTPNYGFWLRAEMLTKE